MSYNTTPAPKRRTPWKIGCLALVVVAVLILGGCGILVAVVGSGDSGNDTSASTSPTQEENQDSRSTPATEESESAEGAITLGANTTGTTASVGWGELGSLSTVDITGEWTQDVTEGDSTYSVTVQDMSMDESAEVSCSIIIDGETVDEQSATGAASIATCTQPLF
ncbi:hypothetical protein FCK90_04375 [Kocuria coralli]|uniref:Uncharacterized protein n=1 Tax=Kocuria coralli TaxID=1461025 RepID=A0A5J5KYP4_9MICC|nr:hypothetical protein [Kocuria coralli]KAA9394779.1 hypothetical protein FCK90_04375 [Kocuria coralli]